VLEKISWTDHVRNEEVLLRVKEQRNILHEISKLKSKWIGHILRRNCLLQQVIKGKIKEGIEVTGSRGRRRRKLLDDLKERRGYSYLKEEALDLTMWRARFGRGFDPSRDRLLYEWMNDIPTVYSQPYFSKTCFGLSCHVVAGMTSNLFHSGFLAKSLSAFLFYPTCSTYTARLIFLFDHVINIWRRVQITKILCIPFSPTCYLPFESLRALQ
jgi:hypothetical protein